MKYEWPTPIVISHAKGMGYKLCPKDNHITTYCISYLNDFHIPTMIMQ